MRRPSLLISLSLAVLLSANVLAQDQIQIQFQTDPVLIQTGSEAVFTVLTVSQVLSMTWQYQGVTLGLWAGGNPVINQVPQFLGRVTIAATQLRIGGAQLRDTGTYSVDVIPDATTGLNPNSRSIQLSVFDAVLGVSLVVPSMAVEGGNVSLSCTWTAGTNITVQWARGGAAITAGSRITISGGSLVISPARRGDAGEYACTVSNPVSAQTATRSLTVFYGPDTPVLTKDSPKDCVGGGDVLVGETVRLTCMSDSLPPALFSWQLDGRPVASGQPDSGVLSVQTFSSDESGRYVCTARNAVTAGTSEQGTVLTIVDTCLNAGEVAGIVIGCVLLIVIIALLIWLAVFLVRRSRADVRQGNTVVVHRTKPNPRPTPPDPQPNGARDLDQAHNPPLYPLNTRMHHSDRLYTAPRENRGDPQTLQLNGLRASNAHQPNGQTHTNGPDSRPHGGMDNPAFTPADALTANPVPDAQQQNPNIVIQAGPAEGGARPPAVHVSLNTLPQTAQQSSGAQVPTIHVSLNSYPASGQQTQTHDGSFPLSGANQTQSGPAYHADPRLNGHQGQPDLIPTGHTHSSSDRPPQRNANTQTYGRAREPQGRSDRNSGRQDSGGGSSRRQMPWDRLRGTPAYPSGTLPRGQTSPGFASDTDYTTHPPIREERPASRPQSPPRSQTASRRRTPPRRDAASADRRARSPSPDLRFPGIRGVKLLEAARRNRRSPPAVRESDHRDIRGSSGSQTAPRQEATPSTNPQARQAPVGLSAGSQGPVAQQGMAAPQGADTRALADPNHLPQAYVTQQHRAAPIQNPAAGQGTQAQPIVRDASRPRQGGTAPGPHPAAQPASNGLTQVALKAHTERAQTFQNRREQTQAALLHPGPQAQAPAAEARRPPTPPPAIPLAQFQALPKKGPQHRSPARGHQPPRPPVNMPVAQRPHQVRHHPNVQQRPATMPAGHHHHHHHHHPHHPHHHTAHFTQPRQQQAHRGRPR